MAAINKVNYSLVAAHPSKFRTKMRNCQCRQRPSVTFCFASAKMHAHALFVGKKKGLKVVACVTNDGRDDDYDDAKHAKNESGRRHSFFATREPTDTTQ